jgi:gliding motility-associated-like protein
MITVNSSGIYTVTLDSLGCSVSDAVMVDVRPFIDEIDLGPDRELCPGAITVLEATLIAGAEYSWSNGADGPFLSINTPGTYSVTATGDCIDATATIVISTGDCATYVYVPNTFTPNGDGINESFLPSFAGPVDEYQLDIFDRWGERIHSTQDRNAGWNGMYNGTPSQDGVYVWTITYRVLAADGVKAETLTGHVTLLR